MKGADQVALELALGWFVAVHVRQSGDAMTPQAAMQRRPRQMRDGRLERIEAVVKRQQCMSAEGNDDSLVFQ